MLKAPPYDFRAGAVAPTAPHKPAELGDPGDGLAQRREYHWTRSMASSTVSTATVVNSSHAIGSPSAGGSTSHTCTAHSTTAGKPSALRCCGGHKVKGQ